MANTKIGDRIVIKKLAADPSGDDPEARDYVGKVGIVESIDDIGQLHGTWGGLGILPQDEYEVLQEGETVHIMDMDMVAPDVFILPRQFFDLLDKVYSAGNANVDVSVDDHSFIGS